MLTCQNGGALFQESWGRLVPLTFLYPLALLVFTTAGPLLGQGPLLRVVIAAHWAPKTTASTKLIVTHFNINLHEGQR